MWCTTIMTTKASGTTACGRHSAFRRRSISARSNGTKAGIFCRNGRLKVDTTPTHCALHYHKHSFSAMRDTRLRLQSCAFVESYRLLISRCSATKPPRSILTKQPGAPIPRSHCHAGSTWKPFTRNGVNRQRLPYSPFNKVGLPILRILWPVLSDTPIRQAQPDNAPRCDPFQAKQDTHAWLMLCPLGSEYGEHNSQSPALRQ